MSLLVGLVEQINYFPQELTTNRYDPWKNIEDEWQRILEGRPNANPPVATQTVRVEIRPFFQGISKRPTRFEVQYWYNGAQQTDPNGNTTFIIQN